MQLKYKEHEFVLNKSKFRAAIALRYHHNVKNLPSKCPCGKYFTITHAMNCKRGRFITILQNEIRDFEPAMLSKACADAEIEPPLQPIANEFLPKICITGDDARLT